MPARQSNLNGALLALTSFGIYATADAIVKYMGASYSPFQNIFFSTLFGFPLVAIMLMGDQRESNLRPRKPVATLLRSGLVVLNVLCGFYAFSALPLSQAYPIFFASPLLITLFAIPILGEKVGLHRGIAVLVGLLGVVVVLRPGHTELGLGHLAAVAASIIFAVSSILVRVTAGCGTVGGDHALPDDRQLRRHRHRAALRLQTHADRASGPDRRHVDHGVHRGHPV